MVEIMKNLLGVGGDRRDSIYEHYLYKSKIAIKQYCGIDKIPRSLIPIVIDLAIFFYQNKDQQGVRQATQGSRSQTLVDGIPQVIKDCLPLPRLRVI